MCFTYAENFFPGLYPSPVGVVTIDSWSQLFHRLKKERLEFWGEKTSFPTHIFICPKGASNQKDNMDLIFLLLSTPS